MENTQSTWPDLGQPKERWRTAATVVTTVSVIVMVLGGLWLLLAAAASRPGDFAGLAPTLSRDAVLRKGMEAFAAVYIAAGLVFGIFALLMGRLSRKSREIERMQVELRLAQIEFERRLSEEAMSSFIVGIIKGKDYFLSDGEGDGEGA